jgi:hypothetical protein
MCLLLIQSNADVNLLDDNNWTPLLAAARGNHWHLVTFLAHCGAMTTHEFDGDAIARLNMKKALENVKRFAKYFGQITALLTNANGDMLWGAPVLGYVMPRSVASIIVEYCYTSPGWY